MLLEEAEVSSWEDRLSIGNWTTGVPEYLAEKILSSAISAEISDKISANRSSLPRAQPR